jgi:hypothetical protein
MADCKEGPRGPMGLRGPAGSQGPAGAPGPQGAQGIQGIQGIRGPKGDKGADGAKGDKGDKGDKGSPGIAGADGQIGPRGFDGKNGLDGADGKQGIPGQKGDKGDRGESGPQGARGESGTTIISSYIDTIGIGNSDAIGDETLLHRASIPGNTLLNNGDEIHIDCYLEYLANDIVNLIFKMDAGNKYTYPVQNADNDIRTLKVIITRVNQNSQLWTIQDTVKNLVSGSIDILTFDVATTSFDLALPMSLDVVADNVALGANQVVLKKCILSKLNYNVTR